jgi:hypothetical protein
MGCNCGKKRVVLEQPQPTPTPEPIKTPDQLHSQQLNDWYNNLDEYHTNELQSKPSDTTE